MSVVIGYVSDDKSNNISVVITDTRVGFGKDSKHITEYDDNVEKLHNIKAMGWCAGTGANGLINLVVDELNKTQINIIHDITDVYKKCVQNIFNSTSQFSKNEIDSTKIILSFDRGDINSLELGYLVGNNDIAGRIHDKIIILYPSDYKNNIDYFEKLEKESYYKFDGDVNKLLYKLASIFKNVSMNSNVVSDTCHIGIFRKINGKFKKELIRDKVDIVLNNLKNNTIDSIIENM